MSQLSLIQHQQAAFDARFYSLPQLKTQFFNANLGFRCIVIASWLLLCFYLAAFFAGSELEYMSDWRPIQFIYAFAGIAVATGLTLAESLLYASGKKREYYFTTAFIICFAVFAETASTMQRENDSVKFKSQHSEVFKATLNAANNLARPTLSNTQVQLGNAQALLSQTQDPNEKAILRSRIAQLSKRVELENSANAQLLTTTLDKAKQLEFDENNHQAIVKLGASLGFEAIQISALLAFFMMLTVKIAGHYLGAYRNRIERAIAINTGSIVFDAELVSDYPPLAANTAVSLSIQSKTADTKSLIAKGSTANTAVHVQPLAHDQQNLSEALINRFIADLKADKVGTSFRELKDWIGVHAKQEMALYKMQDIADSLLKAALGQGAVTVNSEYKEGNRKPKYLINRH